MDVREKLIELLCNLPTPEFVIGARRAGKKLIAAGFIADHLIANGVTVQEWISVDDRLPGKEEYTATTEYGTEYYIRLLIAYKTDTVEYEIGYYDGYKWMTEEPIRLLKDVIAWMPFPNMPQPPKGE